LCEVTNIVIWVVFGVELWPECGCGLDEAGSLHAGPCEEGLVESDRDGGDVGRSSVEREGELSHVWGVTFTNPRSTQAVLLLRIRDS
jgi:hypothetical protein